VEEPIECNADNIEFIFNETEAIMGVAEATTHQLGSGSKGKGALR
jgi:hypothetical protein